MPNPEPPYEILPEDLTADLFKRNAPPTYAQLKAGVAAGRIIELRNHDYFDASSLRDAKDVDKMALEKGMLTAPNFYFSTAILDLMDRMFDFVLRDEGVRESAIKDHPDFDPANPDPAVRKKMRQELLVTFVGRALDMASMYTVGMAKERIKCGLEPDIRSMVSVFPDLKGYDEPVLSLINLFYIDGEGADTHCFIDLMRP